MLTAGGVAAVFVEPSEGAPDRQETAGATAPSEPNGAAGTDKAGTPVVAGVAAPQSRAEPVSTTAAAPAAVAAPVPAEKAVASDAALDDPDALAQQDPRWARVGAGKGAAAFAAALPKEASDKSDEEPADSLVSALVEPSPSHARRAADETRTAAIAPDEALPEQAPPKKSGQPAAADEDDAQPLPGIAGQGKALTMSRGVNMRARPKGGAGVVGVVPRGATVQLLGCDVWCEIVYNGRRGFIYKDFVPGKSRQMKAAADDDQDDVPAKQAEAPPQTKPEPRVKAMSSRLR